MSSLSLLPSVKPDEWVPEMPVLSRMTTLNHDQPTSFSAMSLRAAHTSNVKEQRNFEDPRNLNASDVSHDTNMPLLRTQLPDVLLNTAICR